MFLEALFKLALGLAGAKDEDGCAIAKLRNDGVIVMGQLSGIFTLARIIGWNFLRFKGAMTRLSGAPELLLRG